METKRFTKNDSAFVCAHCGRKVLPLGYSSRNHCPFCLYSLHVDNMPGDRANPCGGLMRPMRADPDAKKGYIITYRCEKCGEVKRNRAAISGDVQTDDIGKIISLTAGVYEEE